MAMTGRALHQLRTSGCISVASTSCRLWRRPAVECSRRKYGRTEADTGWRRTDTGCKAYAERYQNAGDHSATVSRCLGALLYYYDDQGQQPLTRCDSCCKRRSN